MALMLQHDGRTGNTATLTESRCRSLDDTDLPSLAQTSKRQCLDHNALEKSENDNVETKACSMDVTMVEIDTSTLVTTLSPDEILIQMVQSGCYSQEEVVNFCISSGIPLSRMLRLDLMRLSNNTNR